MKELFKRGNRERSWEKERRIVLKTHLFLDLLIEILFVDGRSWQIVLDLEGGVAHLNGQSILEIQQAGLAHVLELGACLTDLGLFVAHAGARTPAKDGERTIANLALLAVLFLHLEASSRNQASACQMTHLRQKLNSWPLTIRK